eukprot:CAMPEP_0206280044 /NCGR_PEP_ID=MMETSP0047_2-20121206/38347_1 /ASSEMBLY_ACC=CAM_ASM_000192 /TAXON_ID=195065 /ORGANISM="Chroomonas mesostigmatica_cf, Strain CCMP1168" /LENGTH=53 /DNA_ID=CAMNT_0053710037 /DNA_START=27 /DNA_END=185 /DNA_ORIENTATION=-
MADSSGTGLLRSLMAAHHESLASLESAREGAPPSKKAPPGARYAAAPKRHDPP